MIPRASDSEPEIINKYFFIECINIIPSLEKLKDTLMDKQRDPAEYNTGNQEH